MVYSYTPTYYSSFHDTITSLCKSILPFNLRGGRQPLPDQKLAKRHSDSLKWQQDSFHRILHLIALHNEGIVPEIDVVAFRAHMLDTLIAAPKDLEPAGVVRDKLLFLQELLYAKCISAEEYHSSKRPLLQRLAVQGVELDFRDVIVRCPTMSSEEEWSVIELRDKEPMPPSAEKSKHRTTIKSFISNAASPWTGKGENKDLSFPKTTKGPLGSVDVNDKSSILMPESSPVVPVKADKGKRKMFHDMFRRENHDQDENRDPLIAVTEEKPVRSTKKQWGLEGLKKWKRGGGGREGDSTTSFLPTVERSDDASSIACTLVASPIGQGPDTKRIKNKIHFDGSASDFIIDKVLGDNIKKELCRIQSELSTKNQNLDFSEEQIEAISTKLPVDKADLNKFFPRSWCDRYGDIVLDVVRKEFKDHVGEMEAIRSGARDKHDDGSCGEKWVAFGDSDEAFHPNLFSRKQNSLNPFV
ncbi:uncharacterized protein LOC122007839 [Zingiber officinale]|uniref:uncharacterized protein LOC122007839 n=1 Tax=Zingiber officinale TaxID=94328 RepID=UPI001C4A77D1|nr:uncharacterized protein LOC122007839 [Zingiber officinale]